MIYSWFFLAVLAPLLWGLVNHADRFLLSHQKHGTGVGSILIFSSVFAVFLLIYITLIRGVDVGIINFRDILSLILIGALGVLAFFLYLSALETEETSIVIPFLQIGPVFGFLLGYVFLGETLSLNQIMASLLILSGVSILSFEFDVDNNIKLKKTMLLLMIGASFFFALNDTLFKVMALQDSFWISSFWQYVGVIISGLVIFVVSKKYREQFLNMFRQNSIKVLSVNVISEFLYLVGNLASNFAMMLAPVALVLVVSSYQPLFVFIIGVLLTTFFPKVATEKLTKKHLVQKMISIVIIVIGSYLLYSTQIS
ncbi:MAG: EamA family transporter [Candidatus Pacebacteria bacterium]|nr:EamA family transporter [Candidatus Paceibacterota bacterium]